MCGSVWSVCLRTHARTHARAHAHTHCSTSDPMLSLKNPLENCIGVDRSPHPEHRTAASANGTCCTLPVVSSSLWVLDCKRNAQGGCTHDKTE
jgi:hypothetical protein